MQVGSCDVLLKQIYRENENEIFVNRSRGVCRAVSTAGLVGGGFINRSLNGVRSNDWEAHWDCPTWLESA